MAFEGYFTYDGVEIINSTRTEAYAADRGWLRAIYSAGDLPAMLGDAEYTDPQTDDAPWVDPDHPESYDFWGVYPVDVVGLEASSRASTIAESTLDGGSPGKVRHTIKTVVFSALVLAGTEEAAAYGTAWLRRVLLGGFCSDDLTTTQSQGLDLGYLSHFPVRSSNPDDDPEETLLVDYRRYLRHVVFNVGPTVTAKRQMTCGGTLWSVSFTGVAGYPHEFGAERPILQGYLDPTVSDPWVEGVDSGAYSTTSTAFVDSACGTDVWQPIYDPLCPALTAPPTPPDVPMGCYDPPATWRRRTVVLPASNVPAWGDVLPTITLYADDEVRNVRIRFYRDPDGDFDPADQPCDYVGEVVVSYIPIGGTFILDATDQSAYVVTSMGHRRRADSLAFASDGEPLEWPVLTCGYQHVITLDTDAASTLPVLDLSLTARAV